LIEVWCLFCDVGLAVDCNRGLPTFATWSWIQSESVCKDAMQRR